MVLDAARNTRIITKPSLKGYRMVEESTIFKGGMVCLNNDGWAVSAANTLGFSRVIGVADETRTAGTGETPMVRVRSGEIYDFDAIGLAQGDVGNTMHVVDDHTFRLVTTNDITAGVLVEFIGNTRGKIHIPAPTASDVGDSDITTAKLADGVLSADAPGQLKMATNYFETAAVVGDKFNNDVFDATRVGDIFNADSITVANAASIIENSAIVADHIAASAVVTDKINNLAVEEGKLDNKAVATGKIADAAVTPAQVKVKAEVTIGNTDHTATAGEMVDDGIFACTPGEGRDLTTADAADIVAEIPEAQVGTWFDITVLSLAAWTVTLQTGGGITITGDAVVAANESGTFRCRLDNVTGGAEEVTIYRM